MIGRGNRNTHMEVWHPEEFKTLCHSSGVSFPVKFLKVIKVFSFLKMIKMLKMIMIFEMIEVFDMTRSFKTFKIFKMINVWGILVNMVMVQNW